MDILIHLLIIVIIAALFFIYRFQDSQNPMLFIIFISVLGIIFLYQDATYITVGSITNSTYNTTLNTITSTSYPIQEPFGFEWALYLFYLSTFLLSIINITTGEEYNKKK